MKTRLVPGAVVLALLVPSVLSGGGGTATRPFKVKGNHNQATNPTITVTLLRDDHILSTGVHAIHDPPTGGKRKPFHADFHVDPGHHYAVQAETTIGGMKYTTSR